MWIPCWGIAQAALEKGHHVTIVGSGDGTYGFLKGQRVSGAPSAEKGFADLIAKGARVDMLAQGHDVSLYLLQEAVRFCRPRATCPDSGKLTELIAKNLQVCVLPRDAELRGIDGSTAGSAISDGSYEALVDLMTTCDRVVGIL